MDYVLRTNEANKATELNLCKIRGSAAQNPHMRAWWAATISFFLAFFGWFAFTGIENPYVATSMGICENQIYPPGKFPKRAAYLKFKDLNTLVPYCQYGKNDPKTPTDCKPVPAAIAALPLCNSTNAGQCATAAQLSPYQPNILAACVCSPGTYCSARLTDASTAAVASTIFTRLGFGTLLELFGPVNMQCSVMIFGAIWVGASGSLQNINHYIVFRFFIGMIGATFVTNQFWNTLMFAPNVVGSANGISAGWGNLGGGVTTAFMPGVLVEPAIHHGTTADTAWRCSMLFPALLMLVTAIAMKLLCWDSPTSRRLSVEDIRKEKSSALQYVKTYFRVFVDPRVLIMFFQYGACFGTELTMYNQLPRHFSSYFQMKATDAAAMAAMFGLTNIFSRPLGGILSDVCFKRWGVRGRLWLHFITLVLEAVFLFGFGFIDNTQPVATAAIVLFIFSIACEMGCGTTYGIVPFMHKEQSSILGAIVGAGGNLGAVISAQCFYKQITDDLDPYKVHGAYVMFFALLTPFLYWPEYGSMFCRARPQEASDVQVAGDGELKSSEDTNKSEFPAPQKIEVEVVAAKPQV